MTLLPFAADRLRPVLKLAALTLAVAILAPLASAQDAAPEPPAPAQKAPEQRTPEQKRGPELQEIIPVHNATAPADFNDLQTVLRNMLPMARIYGVLTQNAIAVRATAEDLATAKGLITELDRPRKAWRVTYTVTEMDNGKPAGTKRVAIIVVEGTRTTLRQGKRMPMVTGTEKGSTSEQNTQIQYLDVGLSIEADIDGGRLRTKVEQSALTDEKSGFGAEDPVVRQTMVEGVANLTPGKSAVLGSLDVPGTARHEEIEVTCEPLM